MRDATHRFSRFFIPVFSLVLAQVSPMSGQKVRIELKEGVTIVHNPKKPAPPPGTPVRLTLIEELAVRDIDSEGRQVFTEPWGLTVDDLGTIYILDFRLGRVAVVGPEGRFIRFIGRRGQGPGELDRPSRIDMCGKNAIMVFNAGTRKVVIFSLKGELLREHRIADLGGLYYFRCDSKGRFFTAYGIYDTSEHTFGLKIFDQDFQQECELCRWTKPSPGPQAADPISNSQQYFLTPDDRVIWGTSDTFDLHIFSGDGKLQRRIIKRHAPLSVTADHKKEIKQQYREMMNRGYKLSFPDHYPAFQDFIVDGEGRIFVRTWERPRKGKGWIYNIFDREGRYIADLELEKRPWRFFGRRMYVMDHGEDDLPVIRRFGVEWNEAPFPQP